MDTGAEREELEATVATITTAMIEYAEAMNLPPAFIEGITADVGEGTATIHNTWVRPPDRYGPEVPLGDIFENGSPDHVIRVKNAQALHWESWEGADYSVAMDHYAKSVHVSGIRALHPMKRGWRTGKRRVALVAALKEGL